MRAKRLDQRRVRQPALADLDTATDEWRAAAAYHCGPHLSKQPGLADSRLTPDQHQPGPGATGNLGKRRQEKLELTASTNQIRARHPAAPHDVEQSMPPEMVFCPKCGDATLRRDGGLTRLATRGSGESTARESQAKRLSKATDKAYFVRRLRARAGTVVAPGPRFFVHASVMYVRRAGYGAGCGFAAADRRGCLPCVIVRPGAPGAGAEG